MNKKWPVIISISIIFLVISVIGLGYFYLDLNEIIRNKWSIVHDYIVGIDSTGPEDYYVLVPIPITIEGQVSDIINETIATEKNGNFELVSTKYGVALNITGRNGNVFFRASKVFTVSSKPDVFSTLRHPNGDIDFNLWVDDNSFRSYLGEVWVYLETTSNRTSISLWLDLGIGDIHHTTKDLILLNGGWNKVKIFYESTVP